MYKPLLDGVCIHAGTLVRVCEKPYPGSPLVVGAVYEVAESESHGAFESDSPLCLRALPPTEGEAFSGWAGHAPRRCLRVLGGREGYLTPSEVGTHKLYEGDVVSNREGFGSDPNGLAIVGHRLFADSDMNLNIYRADGGHMGLYHSSYLRLQLHTTAMLQSPSVVWVGEGDEDEDEDVDVDDAEEAEHECSSCGSSVCYDYECENCEDCGYHHSDCTCSSEDSTLASYHNGPRGFIGTALHKWPDTPLYGLELEFECKYDRESVLDCLSGAVDINTGELQSLTAEQDGSLDDDQGFELIGAPFPLDRYEKRETPWDAALDAVRGDVCHVEDNEDVGMHVTMSKKRSFGDDIEWVKRFVLWYNWLGSFTYNIQQRDSTEYAVLDEAKTFDGVAHDIYVDRRYVAVRVDKYGDRVEVRGFATTTNYNRLLSRLYFLEALTLWTENEDVGNVVDDDDAEQAFRWKRAEFIRFLLAYCENKPQDTTKLLTMEIPFSWADDVDQLVERLNTPVPPQPLEQMMEATL